MLRCFVERGDTVVDIGAHVGTFSVPLAHSVGWEGRVLAFEPNPSSVAMLRLNVILNGLQRVVTVSSLALSSESAAYYVVGNRTANSGASYLSATVPSQAAPRRRASDISSSGADSRAGSRNVATGDRSAEVEPSITVSATRLDDVLADRDGELHASLIKVDVEGMEEAVLAGASKTLERCRPLVYFEVSVEQAERFGLPDLAHIDTLQALEYRFYRNSAARNAATDGFELELVDSCRLDQLVRGGEVSDLLAVPVERKLDPCR